MTSPLLGTLHEFNKVQIIQNISKPSEVMLLPWITTSAVEKQGVTLKTVDVHMITEKATNYGQKAVINSVTINWRPEESPVVLVLMF